MGKYVLPDVYEYTIENLTRPETRDFLLQETIIHSATRMLYLSAIDCRFLQTLTLDDIQQAILERYQPRENEEGIGDIQYDLLQTGCIIEFEESLPVIPYANLEGRDPEKQELLKEANSLMPRVKGIIGAYTTNPNKRIIYYYGEDASPILLVLVSPNERIKLIPVDRVLDKIARNVPHDKQLYIGILVYWHIVAHYVDDVRNGLISGIGEREEEHTETIIKVREKKQNNNKKTVTYNKRLKIQIVSTNPKNYHYTEEEVKRQSWLKTTPPDQIIKEIRKIGEFKRNLRSSRWKEKKEIIVIAHERHVYLKREEYRKVIIRKAIYLESEC